MRQASAWLSVEGQVIGTPTTTSIQTDVTETTSNFYADQTFIFTSGSLQGQARIITSYDGSTKTFTFDEGFTSALAVSDEFAVLSDHVHSLSQINTEVQSGVQSAEIESGYTLQESMRLQNLCF